MTYATTLATKLPLTVLVNLVFSPQFYYTKAPEMIRQNVVDHAGHVVRQTVDVVGVKDYNIPELKTSLTVAAFWKVRYP